MRKTLFAALLLALFAANASAKAVTNPLFMPAQGQILSDTLVSFNNTTDGASNKIYSAREALSFGLTDRLQIGGYLGYAKSDRLDRKDFTNPGVFAVLRLWNIGLDVDLGGRIEFDAFDDISEGGMADGTDKYGFFARAGADLGIFYLGAIGGLDYWDGLGARAMSLGKDEKVYNGDIKAFAIFDVMDIVGLGGEAGYRAYDMGGENYYKGYYLTARLDVNPIPSRIGATAFATYENVDHMDENYTVGLNLKLAI